jgi:hypothetical protein
MLAGRHLVEQLADQPERIHLIVMLAGGKLNSSLRRSDTKAR